MKGKDQGIPKYIHSKWNIMCPLLVGPQSPGLGPYLITAFSVDPLMTTPGVPSGVLNIAPPLNLFPLVMSKFIFLLPLRRSNQAGRFPDSPLVLLPFFVFC